MRRKDQTAPKPAPGLYDWHDLVGIEPLYTQLLRLWTHGRLPTAMAVVGREGIGKKRLITKLLAGIYCRSSRACGGCDICVSLQHGTYTEARVFGNDAAIKIEDIHQMQAHLALTSTLSAHGDAGVVPRAAVLVDADQMTLAASNCLLKTLEEPPPASLIVLTTSRPGRLLPTIRSRCVQWHLTPPPLDLAVASLQKQLRSAEQQVTDHDVQRALKQCGRSPSLALSQLREGQRDLSQRVVDVLHLGQLTEKLAAVATLRSGDGVQSVGQLINLIEVGLNNDYRGQVLSGQIPSLPPSATRDRRLLLQQARRLAIGSRIALNVQLCAEAIALAGQR